VPVLPGVMGIEAFGEAASRLLPGWHIEAVENVTFLSPFKFYRNEPRTATVETAIRPQADALVADCRLIGLRSLPNQADPQVTTHFTAQVRLTKAFPAAVSTSAPGTPRGEVVEAADIYRLYFHGPAYQVVKRAWWDGRRMISLMASELGSNHHPAELPTVFAPRLIELCFQTAGLWELGMQRGMGLPQRVGRVAVLRVPDTANDNLYAVVTPYPEQGCFDAEVVDEIGTCYLQLSGYRTVAFPSAVDAAHLKALQSLMSGEAVRAA